MAKGRLGASDDLIDRTLLIRVAKSLRFVSCGRAGCAAGCDWMKKKD